MIIGIFHQKEKNSTTGGSARCSKFRIALAGLSALLFCAVGETVQAQTWYKEKIWIARRDSVPVYRKAKMGSDTLKFIPKKGMEISDYTLSYDQKWISFSTDVKGTKGHVPVSELDFCLVGTRQYKVVADSVVSTAEVVYPADYQGPALSASQTFYKGDVIRMNRAYPDYYVYQYQNTPADLPASRRFTFRAKIDKNAVAVTKSEPTAVFTATGELEQAVREDYLARTADARRERENDAVLHIVILSLVAVAASGGFVYLNIPMLRRSLFDRSKSNVNISATVMIGSALLMYITGQCLWILTDGLLALALAAVCVLLFFAAVRRAEFFLEARCGKCGNYISVHYLGKTKDGVEWEYDHRHDQWVSYRKEGDTLVEEEVDRNQWLRHRYQMYAFHYKCDYCGHTWKARYKGELTASGHRTEEETTETRYRRR